VVFGDCGQINTFQSPASPDNPLLEEFYIINESFKTVHFRHGKHANFLFADGHVAGLPMEPGTRDSRLKAETLGRIAPAGSLRYLD
jgi:prepilin-type processing-associated H-X9-DG protein